MMKGRRDPQYKTFLHHIGLWAQLGGEFSRLLIDVGRLYPLYKKSSRNELVSQPAVFLCVSHFTTWPACPQ